jgi:hypothetical protein
MNGGERGSSVRVCPSASPRPKCVCIRGRGAGAKCQLPAVRRGVTVVHVFVEPV